MSYLGIDLETFSAADLKAVGAHRYAEDPGFEVLLFGFAFDDDDPTVIDLTAHEPIPKDVLDALRLNGIIKSGWNIAFERACLARHLGFDQPAGQWEDTMVLASVCGLPMGLGDCGAALHMSADKAKDRDGKALIRWFCQPCKPTKTCPELTRHMPADYPDKWARFKEYNGQDVVAERAIRKLLAQWAPTGMERRIWAVDQQINDRGIRVDLTLANAAKEMDAQYKARLTAQAVALTGLENPSSVAQVKAWLAEQEGREFPTLNKKAVADVVASLSSEKARAFMKIRSELARSATKKYNAMVSSACADGHVRGCFQFCGAGRTGRWSGRRVQLQNLAKNKMPDLAACRALVRSGDLEAVELLYGDVASALSELVRTAFIPEEGHKFIVCDYSAIEARVLSWIAGEEWALEEFRGEGQIYEATGAMMFHVPKETIAKGGVNHHRRQAAKTAVLACVAEGELVLTDRGPVPIEAVRPSDRVWDGEEWVRHEGLIRRGVRRVRRVNGIELTGDHKILTEEGMVPCAEAEGLDWARVRIPDCPWPRGAKESAGWPNTNDPALPVRMWGAEGYQRGSPDQEEKTDTVLRVHGPDAGCKRAHDPRHDIHEDIQRLEPDARTVLQSEGQELAPVWGARDHGLRPVDVELSKLPRRHGEHIPARPADRAQGWISWLLPGKLHLGDEVPAGQEQEEQHHRGLPMGADDPAGPVRPDRITLLNSSDPILPQTAVTLGNGDREVETYDLLNAGPRHRFCLVDRETCELRCVSNCGYGGGVNALLAFGADKMGMGPEDMAETVDLWRKANPRVVALWKDLERTAIRCVVRGTEQTSRIGNIHFEMEKGILWMTLPSGRRIAYFGARYGESRWQKSRVLSYMGIEQKTHKWARIETWGGKLTENCWGAGTPVLTDRGWVPIERVELRDKLWDGMSWVSHGGRFCSGRKSTITVDGLSVTPDHLILTTEGWTHAERCEGLHRARVQLPNGDRPKRDAGQPRQAPVGRPMPARGNKDYGHQRSSQEGAGRSPHILRLPKEEVHIDGKQTPRDEHTSGLRSMAVHEGALYGPEAPRLEELWGPWDHGMPCLDGELRSVLERHGADLLTGVGVGPAGQREGVQPGKLPVGGSKTERPEQKRRQDCGTERETDTAERAVRDFGYQVYDFALPAGPRLSVRRPVDPAGHEEQVFDIINAGPHHRYVVLGDHGPMVVHNCVQATARDCLRDAMVNLADAGFDIRAHIHDEVIVTEPKDGRSVEEVSAVMGRDLPWAPGLPLRGDGYECDFYMKD